MANLRVVSVLTILVISSACCVEALRPLFYARSCPGAELIVGIMVRKAVLKDRGVGAGLIRMLFHDCFVQGCDASILIDDPNGNAEKNAVPNTFFTVFDLIDQIKAAVENICTKTVSCADILAFSARASVNALGGPFIEIQGGRFDGLVSSASEVLTDIPSPFSSLSTLKSSFSSKGLSTSDLVLLSGAHTIGKAHCGAFSNRLRNFNSNSSVDPSLDPTLASSLQNQCPANFASTTVVNMDTTSPTLFDNAYFKGVKNKRGLFTSDAALYTESDTVALVDEFAALQGDFSSKFAASMAKMGAIGVKTSANGNIRTNCRSFT